MRQRSGAVAAGHFETAHAAAEILKSGGNAFDAAIGGLLVACVAEPVLASLGGGGFLAARTADGCLKHIDFFAQTPLVRPDRKDIDFFPIMADFGTAQQEFHIGMGSVATPGAVAGIFHIHQTLGHMSFEDIACQARELAKKGVVLNPFQAYLLSVVGPIYQTTEKARHLFCASHEAPYALKTVGDRLAFPNFAVVLDQLTNDGPEGFYLDHIANQISGMNGCTIGASDLASYSVIERQSLKVPIKGADIYLNAPPAIGGALIGFMLEQADQLPEVCDISQVLGAMMAANQARRDSNIDFDPSDALNALRKAQKNRLMSRGTTHISVADADGNLAALTISNGEGCGHVVPGTDIMLNNMLGEEDLNAGGFFNWKPRQRLSSMMSPGVMQREDGAWVAFGSGGSNRIRSALFQVIHNMAVSEMSLADAIAAPRMHLENQTLSIEPGLDEIAIAGPLLKELSVQHWDQKNMFFGGVHAVVARPDGTFDGVGDERRDGVAIVV